MGRIIFIDGLSGFTFVDSATATGTSVTVPAGAAAGDLGVYIDIALGAVTPVTPSGHTLQLTNTYAPDGESLLRVSTKILDGSEPGNSITGMDGPSQDNKKYLVFRPIGAIATVTSSTWTAEGTPSNPSSQSILASGQTPPLVVIGIAFCNDSTSNQFSTASPAFDAEIGVGSSRMSVGYKIYNSGDTPADHTIDMIDEGGGNWLAGGYLRAT